MRTRPIAALSALVLAGALLAGCSGATPAPTPTDAATAALCAAAAPSGKASEAVKVDGKAGTESTATFTAPLTFTDVQRTVIAEGDGDAVSPGDYVNYALSAFDAETGAKVGAVGYTPGELLPQPISADSPLGKVIGCAKTGSRFVATFPATESASGQVYIFDFLSITPLAAWGEPQAPVDGMPTVTLADDGTPTVKIPDAAAPTDVQIAVLKKGDGIQVADGDTTLLQYSGSLWATGKTFDDSWSKGAPISSPGNQYVPGFVKALAGQTVGSQVLVVIPPDQGYGDTAQNGIPGGSTLVFVIDILATQHSTTQ